MIYDKIKAPPKTGQSNHTKGNAQGKDSHVHKTKGKSFYSKQADGTVSLQQYHRCGCEE